MVFLFAVRAFTEMTQYLLNLPGTENLYVLSERFSQDPLENYFGQQRGRGGRNDNPTVSRCLENASALRVQKSAAMNPVRGNCREKRHLSPKDMEEALQPLQKRKRHH